MFKCKVCGSKHLVLIEYAHNHPDRYDGISEVLCNACGVRIGRWSGKVLQEGESEKRFGGKIN